MMELPVKLLITAVIFLLLSGRVIYIEGGHKSIWFDLPVVGTFLGSLLVTIGSILWMVWS